MQDVFHNLRLLKNKNILVEKLRECKTMDAKHDAPQSHVMIFMT